MKTLPVSSLKSLSICVSVIFALCLVSVAQAKPGTSNCQTNGPFTLCNLDDGQSGNGVAFRIAYSGYLKTSGSTVHIHISPNVGTDEDDILNDYQDRLPLFQVIGPFPKDVKNLTVYAYDDHGNYDSNFGRNFQIDVTSEQ